MLISEWMTKEVITVTPQTNIFKAAKILKSHDIRRLPVVDENGLLVGIISDRDIKESSPSNATTLDVYELMYVLSEIKVHDIMTKDVITVKPSETVERVALLMEEKGFGGVPVVDDSGQLVGIITDNDIFKVFVAITGVRTGGTQFALEVSDQAGTIRPIFDCMRGYGVTIASMLTTNSEKEGKRRIYIRIKDLEQSKEDELIAELKAKFDFIYYTKDEPYVA